MVHGKQLQKGINGWGYFALAFGTIVGSAWMVLMGEWVAPAGPGGAALAFLAMAVLMVPIAGAYAELAARVPKAGAEFVFVQKAFGPAWGFVTGWFLLLYYIGIAAFECVALAWFVETLFPALREAPTVYVLLGKPVTVVDLAIGVTGVLVITAVNSSGTRVAVGFQKAITYSFLAATTVLIALGWTTGDAVNWTPLFESAQDRSFWGGMFVMMATAGMWLSGFQTAAAAVEERAVGTSFRTVARCMMGAVALAAIFYCLAILGTSSLIPWKSLMGGDLPVAAAFERALPGSGISTVICVIAMAALIKTWNAMHLGASRIMLAQARSGALPAFLAEVSPATGAPRPAAIMVGGLTFLGIIAGRGAILPIISMSTMCTTIIAVLALVSLMRLRKADRGDAAPDYVFPGGGVALAVITIGAAIVAAAAIAAPFGLSSGMPVEIVVLLGWLAIACVVLIMRARRIRPDARSSQA